MSEKENILENGLLLDEESRNRIVNEINSNFFVEAGAGSGKTTMLVNRMVAMVESGIDIDKICAITFTRAAANEFYERFQKILIDRSNPDYEWEDKGYAGQLPKPTEVSRERCARALGNINLCFMGTIDSFCSMILSEYPSEAGVPSDAKLISEEEEKAFYKAQYVQFRSFEDKSLAKMAGLFATVHSNPETIFAEGESVIMNNRNINFIYNKLDVWDIDRAFQTEKSSIIKLVKIIVDHPEFAYTRRADSRDAWDRIQENYTIINGSWNNRFHMVEAAINSIKKIGLLPGALDNYGEIIAEAFEPYGKTGGYLTCKKNGLLSVIQEIKYSVSMRFLTSCVPYLERAMLEKGYMRYFDYLYYLREMLRKDAADQGKLIAQIRKRHSYYLIDEFQDTDPIQSELFFYLAAENPVSNWRNCVPAQGALFIVGDPKQSIYRFRGADVTSFYNVRDLFTRNGGVTLSLLKNHRSKEELCKYFNDVFTDILSDDSSEQSAFSRIPVLNNNDTKEIRLICTYDAIIDKKGISEHPEAANEHRICSIIKRLAGNENYKIKDEVSGELRTIQYRDIMVITGKKNDLRPLINRLSEEKIPLKIEGSVPFAESEALKELYMIYAAVSDPDDQAALFGAMTGKTFGLSKERIVGYKINGKRNSLPKVSTPNAEDFEDTIYSDVSYALKRLNKTYTESRSLTPAALFAKIYEEYRIYETIEVSGMETVCYTLELLRDAEKTGTIITQRDGKIFLEKLFKGDSDIERCLNVNERVNAVHMANLHKVKGLEAPVVILSCANPPKKKNPMMRIDRSNGENAGYIFEMKQKGSFNVLFSTGEFSEQSEAEGKALDAERDRLLYVAATRAKNMLIIGKTKEKEAKWDKLVKSDLPDFFEVTEENLSFQEKEKTPVSANALYDEAEKTCVLNDGSAKMPTFSVMNPSRQHSRSKLTEESDVIVLEAADDAAPEGMDETPDVKPVSAVHRNPALLGTMTHKLMEMLVSTRNYFEPINAVSEIIGEFLTPGTQDLEGEFRKALLIVAEKMRNGGYPQSNGLPQDMLETLLSADEVYCEVPFCYSEGGSDSRIVWNGIMDVVYCKDGKWHIVDYKTNADGNDLDIKYQEQLSAYIKAFRSTTGEEADALTYHIDI